jgi:hypothetical protein
MRNTYKTLVRKSALWRPMQSWEDNIKMYLKEIGYKGVHWIHLEGLVAGFCEHSNESLSTIKGREFLDKLRDYQLLTKDSAP